MKIAIWYNLASGGAKRALYNQVEGLMNRGHSIAIWRPPVPQKDYLDLSLIAPEHEIEIPFREQDSWFYPRKIKYWANRMDRQAAAMAIHSRECVNQMHAWGYDILFANTDLQFHAPFIGRFARSPKLAYIQEPNRYLFEALPRLPWLLPPPITEQRWLKRLRLQGRDLIMNRHARVLATEEVENAQHYDRILVNSYFSRESIMRAYGTDSKLCYLGIDTQLFTYRRLPREPYVISVGSFYPQKGPQFIVESIARIPKPGRPPLLWCYNFADEEYLAQMVSLAKSLDVDFRPKHLVPDELLVDLLNRATAFVYAPKLEPFGLAPLEASACGTPVVAVAEGGVRETIVHGTNGLLADSDPDSMAQAVQQLLANPVLARQLGETGERIVREQWSPDAATDRIERHLLEVIEGHQSPG